MKIRNIFIAALPAMLMLASCDEKTEYVGAQPEDPNCMGVYFDADNEEGFIFIPGTEASIVLKMHRLKAEAAADVPLITHASSDGISIPQTVHFDAGSKDSEIVIDCNNLPEKQLVSFSIDLPDDYINHYAETIFNYESTALMSMWEPANLDGSPVTFYFTEYDFNAYTDPRPYSVAYQPIESEMEVLPGAGMIRIHNFINTGTDMVFTFSESPYPDYTGMYRVMPTDHYYTMAEAYESDDYADPWYNGWFVINDEDDYAECTLNRLSDGVESVLDYPYILCYSDSYAFEYSYAVFKSNTRAKNSISMGLGGTPNDNNVSLPQYLYLFFSWDGESGL